MDLLKKLKNATKKITRQIPQGQYAYCKYFEIIRVGVFEWEQRWEHHHIVGGDKQVNVIKPSCWSNVIQETFFRCEKNGSERWGIRTIKK